jgi:hypothetical protein
MPTTHAAQVNADLCTFALEGFGSVDVFPGGGANAARSESRALAPQTVALAHSRSHSSRRGRNASLGFALWFEAPRSLVA